MPFGDRAIEAPKYWFLWEAESGEVIAATLAHWPEARLAPQSYTKTSLRRSPGQTAPVRARVCAWGARAALVPLSARTRR